MPPGAPQHWYNGFHAYFGLGTTVSHHFRTVFTIVFLKCVLCLLAVRGGQFGYCLLTASRLGLAYRYITVPIQLLLQVVVVMLVVLVVALLLMVKHSINHLMISL
jgi:hypothetical protein